MQGSCLQLGAISYYFDKNLLKTYGEHIFWIYCILVH